MNIFKNYTYAWWQIGLLKIALLAIGIAIGANWSSVFLSYTSILVLLGIAIGVYLFVVSFKK